MIFVLYCLIALPEPELLNQNKEFWLNQLHNPSVDLQINALNKLAELRQPDLVPKIGDMLRESNPEVRFYALVALTKLPTEESLTYLKAHLNEESDPYLKAETKRSIKSIEDLQKSNAERDEAAANKAKKQTAKPKSK